MHIFAIVCGLLSTAGAIYVGLPYMLTIIRGDTKPHQFTWLIFCIMNGVIVISQYLEGARLSILVYLIFFINSAIIFGLSLKYGVRNSSRYDWLLLSLAIGTIVLWVITKSNLIAIWLTIIIDSFATTMLILKIRRHPGTEPFYLWFIGTMSLVFSCLSLVSGPLGILYLRPVYGVLSDVAVLVAIVYFRPSDKNKMPPKPTFPEV